MSIFMMVMIGGGIIYIDDKARGLHEGYLVTPVTKLELVAGFNLSGTLKAFLAGAVITIVGSYIAGVANPLEPLRLLRTFLVVGTSAFALVSLMFLLMVRMTDPLAPRAMFGVLNTVLYFPSGAVYPQQGFPGWMHVIASVDPVHLLGARVQEPAAEKHRLRGHRRRPALPRRVLGDRDDSSDDAVQENAVGGEGERGRVQGSAGRCKGSAAVQGECSVGAKGARRKGRGRRWPTWTRVSGCSARRRGCSPRAGDGGVTVRAICRAAQAERRRHQLSLLTASAACTTRSVQSAIDQMRATTASMIEAGRGQPPSGS